MKKLLALLVASLLASSAFAATAFWTGEVEYVTTVTYQTGVRCGYNYAGQHFYMVFSGGTCPMSVNVN